MLYDLLKICRTDQIYLHMYALNAGPRLYQLLVTRNPILKNIKTTIPDRNIPREVKLTILQVKIYTIFYSSIYIHKVISILSLMYERFAYAMSGSPQPPPPTRECP